ncbi:MAG: hypothetical protein JWM86_757, partial [Thermoleophilia bacterium]|nr:hypothetical protein [Thermoleophilia bacterium]
MSSTPQRPAPPKTKPGSLGDTVLWSMLGDAEHLQGIDDYVAAGGDEQLPRAIKAEPDALVQERKDANLRGRGGAG